MDIALPEDKVGIQKVHKKREYCFFFLHYTNPSTTSTDHVVVLYMCSCGVASFHSHISMLRLPYQNADDEMIVGAEYVLTFFCV